MYSFEPTGVCPVRIDVELSEDMQTVESVVFERGCNGNLKAIGKLVAGMKVDDVADLLGDNECGNRGTSCAAQMVLALREAQQEGVVSHPYGAGSQRV